MNEVRNKIKSRLSEIADVTVKDTKTAKDVADKMPSVNITIADDKNKSQDKSLVSPATSRQTPSTVPMAEDTTSDGSGSPIGSNPVAPTTTSNPSASDGAADNVAGMGQESSAVKTLKKKMMSNPSILKSVKDIFNGKRPIDKAAITGWMSNLVGAGKKDYNRLMQTLKAVVNSPQAQIQSAGYISDKPMVDEESINPKMTKGDLVKLVSENTKLKVVERIKVKDLKN